MSSIGNCQNAKLGLPSGTKLEQQNLQYDRDTAGKHAAGVAHYDLSSK